MLVVFDVDDTLYLEMDYVSSGFASVGRFVASEWGIVGFREAASEVFDSGIRGVVFQEAFALLGSSPPAGWEETLLGVYRDHEPQIELLPDASKCLAALSARPRTGMGIVTDGPASSQRAKIAALGLYEWVTDPVVTEERGPEFHKPSPRAFQELQAGARQPPEACYYVADNPSKDFAGPFSIGWRTVRVRRPTGLHHAVASLDDVWTEIEDLDALWGLLVVNS